MERHSLLQHIHRQRRFAHAIIARHTLAQHMRGQQLMPKALGLRAKTTQPISKPTIQSVRQLQPLSPLLNDPNRQTSPASSTQNEVEPSSTQLISEPQESLDIPTSHVNQYIPEQDAEAASIIDTAENILPIPPVTSNTQQETIRAINEQIISMPETLAPLLSQETTQPDLSDPQDVNTDEQSQHIPPSLTIAPDTTPQQTPQIDEPKDESGQVKLPFKPASLEQNPEADRVVSDQPVQAQSPLNEPALQPTFSDVNLAVATDLASALDDPQQAQSPLNALDHPQQALPSQDNQKPVTGNTQEQRPRKRGRIEEQPQSSTPRTGASPVPTRIPTNTETKNHTEQTISDIATTQTSKFSPQEWYARLVKAEQEAQAKQSEQGLTPTIPQVVHSIEPTREPIIPGNQSATNAKSSTEPTVHDDSIPIKGIPLVKNTANSAAVTNALSTSASSAPVSQQARRFLRPLVGIDPTSVDIHRDRQAEQLTTAYRADAITIGNNVALAAEHSDDTPETLGLLAHELTHVARQREPRYIPPIVRSANTPTTTNQSPQPRIGVPGSAKINGLSNSAIGYNTSASEDEEALAQRVEARVTRAARQGINQEATTNSLRAGPSEPAGFEATPVSTGNTWGGLPAPWEPLPNWLVGDGPATTQNHIEAGLASTQNHVGVGLAPTQNPTVQRAGKERGSIDDELYSSSSQSTNTEKSGNSQQELEPDLDDLARQVYTRLKHRLGVENRRERL